MVKLTIESDYDDLRSSVYNVMSSKLHSVQVTADGRSVARARAQSTNENAVKSALIHLSSGQVVRAASTTSSTQTRNVTVASVEVQTDVSTIVEPEMTKESLLSATPNAAYYCALAKERERALSNTLEENLQLVGEVARMREENTQLRQLAQEGERYAQLLAECIDAATEDTENTPPSDC